MCNKNMYYYVLNVYFLSPLLRKHRPKLFWVYIEGWLPTSDIQIYFFNLIYKNDFN